MQFKKADDKRTIRRALLEKAWDRRRLLSSDLTSVGRK